MLNHPLFQMNNSTGVIYMPNKTTFAEQINLSQHKALRDDAEMLSIGLGINDPKGIFGTTLGLAEEFGERRVFDMPTSENAMTGIGVGAALSGSRVLMTHQRVDFFLLAMDQLVNNAAKWSHMFNGQMKVPLTIRLIIGRGWGQGPTHQQNLQSWFTHIPGLKVVVPSTTNNVGQLLYSSIMDNNPVVFLEHRWLHNQQCDVDDCVPYHLKPSSVRKHRQGNDFTLIANSYMLLEALHTADRLGKEGINCDVIEISEPTDIDWQVIYQSVNKTGRCLVVDIDHLFCSLSSEISARITEKCFSNLKAPPLRIGLPDYPEPTSYSLTKSFYNNADNLIRAVDSILGRKRTDVILKEDRFHDVPGNWFTGPF